MSLSSYKISASIAVSDMERAGEFYEGKLGLSSTRDEQDGSRIYECGGETSLHVYPSAANAGNATVATWYVTDLEEVVDELTANSVRFEHYDEPEMKTDERGILTAAHFRVAWFKDPDGNTFAIEQ